MPSLLLHAGDPHWVPDRFETLVDALRDVGLIGAVLGGQGEHAYRAGESFLSLIMFLGCSPQVELDPDHAPSGASLCYLQLHQYADVSFVSAERRPQPRCPGCRAPVEALPDVSSATVYTCPACTASHPLPLLDWRRGAAFGRCFIEVHGVYPQEAVPADKLLARLESVSAGCWDYFYT